jgi:hypothetical protein
MLFGNFADTQSRGQAYAATSYAFDAVTAAALVADAALWLFVWRDEMRLNGRSR